MHGSVADWIAIYSRSQGMIRESVTEALLSRN